MKTITVNTQAPSRQKFNQIQSTLEAPAKSNQFHQQADSEVYWSNVINVDVSRMNQVKNLSSEAIPTKRQAIRKPRIYWWM